jgi:hypothetical protein
MEERISMSTKDLKRVEVSTLEFGLISAPGGRKN